jgi:lysophospholipase L1-like esterase
MPGASCMKNSSLAVSIRPPQDSVLPVATDSALTGKTDTTTLTWLALGDSYTIGQSVAIEDRYPVQAMRLLQADHPNCSSPEIIATTGWTTADLLNALVTAPPALSTLKPAQPYNIVTLLIGVNNQYQGRSQSEYSDQFTSLLRQSIALAGNRASHVIVLSIPDYSVTPFAHGRNTALIAAQIDSFNLINYKLSQDYQVHYLDITADSRLALNDPSLIATDGLHFSGKEYAIWAEKLEPLIKGGLK